MLRFGMMNSFLPGIDYRYNSTGSRIGQRDYSGFYTFDQIVSAHFPGIHTDPQSAVRKNLSRLPY